MSAPSRCPALFHVGMTVSDMDRVMPFYVDGLELTLRSDRVATSAALAILTGEPVASMRIVLLDVPGGGVVELLQYHPTEAPSPGEPLAASRPGTAHLCLFVEDVTATARRLLAHGGTQVSDHEVSVSAGEYAGRHCLYVRDPDGFVVELFSAADVEVVAT